MGHSRRHLDSGARRGAPWSTEPTSPEDFFAGSPLGIAVFRRVDGLLRHARPDVAVRVSTSQVAFRRRRGFAYLWRPGRYLRNPAAEVVLSIALAHHDRSRRFKEAVHPSPTVWMHHLEIHSIDDVDHEVEAWLLEAADAAAASVTDDVDAGEATR